MPSAAPARWTLEELSARVRRALAHDYEGVPNGQVSDVPNARTIRYYATLGLVDRPAAMRGRTALYGVRHLLQLVAIKRLQAEGLPLVEVQESLAGLPEESLRRLARVPLDVERDDDNQRDRDRRAHTDGDEPRRDRAFWAEVPTSQIPPAAPSLEGALAGLRFEGGLALTFPSARPLDEEDLSALRDALGPLLEPVLDVLRARGLVPPTKGEESR